MNGDYELETRQILLSTGEFTTEAVIWIDGMEFYDSVPIGLTVGLKERQLSYIDTREIAPPRTDPRPDITGLNQAEFDALIAERYSAQTGTAFSLAYLRYLASKNGFSGKRIYEFVARKNEKTHHFQR